MTYSKRSSTRSSMSDQDMVAEFDGEIQYRIEAIVSGFGTQKYLKSDGWQKVLGGDLLPLSQDVVALERRGKLYDTQKKDILDCLLQKFALQLVYKLIDSKFAEFQSSASSGMMSFLKYSSASGLEFLSSARGVIEQQLFANERMSLQIVERVSEKNRNKLPPGSALKTNDQSNVPQNSEEFKAAIYKKVLNIRSKAIEAGVKGLKEPLTNTAKFRGGFTNPIKYEGAIDVMKAARIRVS